MTKFLLKITCKLKCYVSFTVIGTNFTPIDSSLRAKSIAFFTFVLLLCYCAFVQICSLRGDLQFSVIVLVMNISEEDSEVTFGGVTWKQREVTPEVGKKEKQPETQSNHRTGNEDEEPILTGMQWADRVH